MTDHQSEPPVLIVGAGPTGMVLALWLQKLQVPFRIVERAASTGTTTRALVVHARAMELYRQLGIADRVVERGIKLQGLSVFQGKKQMGLVRSGQAGKDLSPFPFFLSLAQDLHEELLEEILAERGVTIERKIEAVGLIEKAGRVEVQLRKLDGGSEETFTASYVAGCDGAHSAVRTSIGVHMDGGTYDGSFFVADAEVSAVDKSVSEEFFNMCVSDKDFCVVIPLRDTNKARLAGFVPERLQDAKEVHYDDIKDTVLRNAPLRVEKVLWFSHYRVHHRAAGHFRRGNVFLLGDACHLHSPAGGQGLNTGLGDAANLAWKLAAAYKSGAPASLLDTYEDERRAFALKLVSTTDYVFQLMTRKGLVSRLMRNFIIPYVMPTLVNWLNLLPIVFKRLSQIEIEYRQNDLSLEIGPSVGSAVAGDRMPWVPPEIEGAPDNFTPLESAEWQGFVYGEARPIIKDVFKNRGLALNVYPWSPRMEQAGLVKDHLYVVRPDGYIGLKMPAESDDDFEERKSALYDYLIYWRIGRV